MLKIRQRQLSIASVARGIKLVNDARAHELSYKPSAKFITEQPKLHATVAKQLYRTEQDILHELLYPADFR
jgi:hypothetical protein